MRAVKVDIEANLYRKVKEYVSRNRIDFAGGVKQFVNIAVRDKLKELGVIGGDGDGSTINTAPQD